MVKIRRFKRAGKLNKDSNIKISSNFKNSNQLKHIKNEIRKKNPIFYSFTLNSTFIYESKLYSFYLRKIKNFNILKPNKVDISIIKNIIKDIEEYYNDNNKFIEVPKIIYELFTIMKKTEPMLNKTDKIIQNLLTKDKGYNAISLRKIKKKLLDDYNINISTTKISNILKNKLNHHYLKTAVKNIELTSKKYITMGYFFLKIVVKSLKLGGTLVFIDESGFLSYNPNYRTWRNNLEDVYSKLKTKQKTNLIMAVSKERIIYYELTDNNVDSAYFLSFMESFNEKLSDKDKKESVIVLDNLPAHATAELFKFYSEKKMKVVFNVPYLSKFNMIEICFRALKNKIYKNLHKNINDIKKEIKEYIEGEYLRGLLGKLYKETLNKYLNFIDNNFFINLN